MKFEEAIQLNDLGNQIEAQYGQWGHFTKENADAIVKIALDEAVGWQMPPETLMAMTAFTWMNESTWNFKPEPNVNSKRWSVWHWDIGPFQLNLQWAMRMAWQQDFKTKDLNWKEVFGSSFYAEDGVTPVPFNGDVITHGRCALRRLLYDKREPGNFGFADRETMRIVLYTGPKAQPARLKTWNKYGEHFKEFFRAYTRPIT